MKGEDSCHSGPPEPSYERNSSFDRNVLLSSVHVAPYCQTVPCRNQGSCLSDEDGVYSCHCRPGFEGLLCEKGISLIPSFSGTSQESIPLWNRFRFTCIVATILKFCNYIYLL